MKKEGNYHGTARFANKKDLRRNGLLKKVGIVCGQTNDAIIQVDKYDSAVHLKNIKEGRLICHSGMLHTLLLGPSGEGKSFISSNLAISLSLLGKKVVIVGLDIRKPGLNKIFNIPRKEQGITQYLSNPDKNLMDFVQPSDVSKNLFILPGGTVPPNPTELLARDSLDKAIEVLKKNFDYIILDTAPVGMVTDTLLVGRVADLSVYVCRADYTRKAEFTLINELADSNKLPNLCTVINGLDLQKKKYGYYYGYGKYGKYYGYGKRYGYGYGYGETHHGGKGERTEE